MLFLLAVILMTSMVNGFFHHIHSSKLPLLLSSSLPFRPEFLKEINENQVLRERLADDEDSILLYKDLSTYGFDVALAEEHINIGNYAEAETLALNAMSLADHSKQVNNIYSAYAKGILADCLYAEGKYQVAADYYKEAFECYKRHYRSDTGPESVELMGALQLIAWVLLSKKDYDEATTACENALGITQRLLGPENVDVASSMVNLATAYVNKGDIGSEPEILLTKALNTYNKKSEDIIDKAQYSDEMKKLNFLIGSVQVSMGSLMYLRGKDDLALEHYNIVIKMFENGSYDYTEAVQALKNAALILWRRNQLADAEKLLARALFKFETSEKYGTEHVRTKKLRLLLNNLREGKDAPPMSN